MKKNIFLLIIILCSVFNAQAQIKNNPAVQISNSSFNSSDDDFPNGMTKSGGTLYITSERSGEQRIYIVNSENNAWSSPQEIDDIINDAAHSGSASLTPDGQYIVFAAYKHSVEGAGRTDLYSARKELGKWTDVQNLGPIVNSDAWDATPSLSNDGTVLFFSSDRAGGKGGTDIYMARRTREGWTRPTPVNEINSSSDETTPFIAADGKTLYFASNKGGGVGGHDIYVSRKSGESFASPTNIGTPINSEYDEIAYIARVNSDQAYFASSRTGGNGALDVYYAAPNPEMPSPVAIMRGIVSDKVTGKPLGADIVITDLKTRKQVATLRSDDITGEYFVTVPAERDYLITARRPDYLFYSERLTVPALSKGTEVENNIQLSPYSQGETRLMVFFDFNKTELKEESYPDLDNAIQFLQEKSDVNIGIEGHTDNVGDPAYNLKLSKDRASSVVDYLVKNGIDKKRISSTGFGEKNPKVPNNNDENRAKNRRVEMKVMK